VVRSLCNFVVVMYLGKVVEMGQSEELFSNPLHPYTQVLLSATPVADPRKARLKKRTVIKGELPSPVNLPSGCRFRTRCPYQVAKCAEMEPSLEEYLPGHSAACHLSMTLTGCGGPATATGATSQGSGSGPLGSFRQAFSALKAMLAWCLLGEFLSSRWLKLKTNSYH
jgi:oligopeptide/dipeptide ABC transporter ATP-binding protein